MLEGVNPEHVAALDALIQEHKPVDSGNALLKAQAVSDLNGDGQLDGVVVFTYQIGPSQDRSHTEFLTIVSSSPSGYTASWPVIVGARGFRYITEVQITGARIVLRGDFTVADETANMATLNARGEIYYSYEDGRLREQGGQWSRKAGQ